VEGEVLGGRRVSVFPYEILVLWERIHGALDEAQRERFIADPLLTQIGTYSANSVRAAIANHIRLADALKALSSSSNVTPRNSAPAITTKSTQRQKSAVSDDRFAPSMPWPEKWEAQKNRLENPTPEEALLWDRLRDRRLDGFIFVREQNIKSWFVDFYCAAGRLIVEVDGPIHDTTEQRKLDARRDFELQRSGYRVLRLSAAAVRRDPSSVAEKILEKLDSTRARQRRDVYLKAPEKSPPSGVDTSKRRKRSSPNPKANPGKGAVKPKRKTPSKAAISADASLQEQLRATLEENRNRARVAALEKQAKARKRQAAAQAKRDQAAARNLARKANQETQRIERDRLEREADRRTQVSSFDSDQQHHVKSPKKSRSSGCRSCGQPIRSNGLCGCS
jgi:very-short-patch-repair endonuclease